ncbi:MULTISPECIES: redox-sensing transcriptional repressor Rex [Aminobacterium]|jgi:redox-sensing transcriptional repressor|uniref:Redox-sensing transcriptional repressor Rex n=1 Tax=Aminobacterium colombiense (strain DSM 12261 / ALA-1) TaxID=572547 RepID=D5EDU3_AMICL|nr:MULTISPECIES: redox-sensing transcriptional repressor Rex [Aminobacterium]MDD2379044.1 redox-sensing transcriptional repressor Rex [Aminobacterium colombiense]ADE56725.1 CoA-binding domain protein [Aminobacterium colombiense DSM 12261]MDD3767305.1 redox-sensing transcriptional repressor Rex [Aminobacterium colombiense]MDD4265334.1 redox-sensing transcriptional repressor Rex [Aminobacterium colombiense]MDD4586044.1 redox-sensing transcriptional repressor Rex [Aminobacterium colombiense]
MKIAEPTVERLVQYHRLLEQLYNEGQKVVSSQEIGEMLAFKASQVRKDLSYFGEIGKRGVGYHVEKLYRHIDGILASPRKWPIALIGVGRLGEALLGHKAFKSPKFDIKALFDVNPEKVGRKIAGISCYHVDDISDVMRKNGIEVVILTVPSSVAQECVDKIVQAGTVKGILNFSPLSIVAPDSVLIYSVDISVELEKLLFYLKHREER